MKAKEYLQQLRRLDTIINQKNNELADLRMKSRSIGSVDSSKERVQTSPSGDASFVNIIGRMIDLEEEIKQETKAFVCEKHKIINQIQGLKNADYISLLYKRYVEYKSLGKIAAEMNFSYDHIKHLHGYALIDFERKYFNSAPHNT